MTNEELVELCQRGDEQALDTLIQQNTGIVYKLANKYYSEKTNSIDKDDLIQEGYIGLMIAADKYNSKKENAAQFITYAVYWIRQGISRYINQKHTNEENSLHMPIDDSGNSELIETIKDTNNPYLEIEEKLYIQELRGDLEDVMNEYTSLKEREIIKLKYGWDGNREMTDAEVGEIFLLTKYQVNDIRNRAFHKMRRSPWGECMAKEKYKEKEWESIQNIDKLVHKMDFANRYLIKEVDL